MNITSFEFALFFAVVLPLNWLLRSFSGAYRLFLLLASYVFYASFNAKFLLILLVFSFLTWFFAVVFAETSDARFRRFCLILYVGFSLGMLIFFKYYEMLYISADWLFRLLSISSPVPLLDVIMPIGISFFTFQGMSYAIDVYRDPGKVERSLVEVFCFISFFPTILSGPILRAGNFLGQLQKKQPEQVDFTRAFYLLTRGLVKKIIISSYLSEHIVRVTFGAPSGYSSAAVLVGILSYTMQIYCDFSGYSDLAQGVGLLMGFDIPDNFNAPYTSRSLRDFWRRWHITFSTWLRDYLYISLGGNRKGTGRKYLNLVTTMALGGLWHGAAYNFLVWGFIHGFGLVGAHMVGELRASRAATRAASRAAAIQAAGAAGGDVAGEGTGAAAAVTSGAKPGTGAAAAAGAQAGVTTGAKAGKAAAATTGKAVGAPTGTTAGATTGKAVGATTGVAAGAALQPSPGWAVTGGLWNALCWVVTFAYVNVAWVFFGAEDAGKAVEILRRVAAFDADGAGFRPTCLILVGLVLAVQLLHLTGRDVFRKSFEWLPFPAQGAALGVISACILKLGPDGVLPFIYFQF